jgi:hypothetical protein
MYLQTENRRAWLRYQRLSRGPYKHKDASVMPRSVRRFLRHDRVMPLNVMAAEMADLLRGAELTCREGGRTASVLPPGCHHLRRSAA